MNKFNINRKSAQAGFTLIELIVVIVILGILAATALPKFASVGSDARVASLLAARSSLNATAAMAHGRFLSDLSGTPLTSINVEGVTLNYATVVKSGYPLADSNFTDAAGLVTDYTVYDNPSDTALVADTTAHKPPIPAYGIAIVPKGVADTATAETCFITYTEPTALKTAPKYSAVPSANGCD